MPSRSRVSIRAAMVMAASRDVEPGSSIRPLLYLDRCSVVRHAAVRVNGLTGDETPVVGDQEQAGGGDLVHRPLTSQWNAGGGRRSSLVPLGIGPRGVDAAGTDHVDPNIVRGELGGETARQPHQAHLRGRDMGAPGSAHEGPFTGEE